MAFELIRYPTMRSQSLINQGFLRLALTLLFLISAIEGASTPILKLQSGLFGLEQFQTTVKFVRSLKLSVV
jgi:hypothetical protein